MEEQPPIWWVAVNILNKQPHTADKKWSSSLWVRRGANSSLPKLALLCNGFNYLRTRNVRSQYRPGSLITVTRALARFKLDLVGVQELMWEKGGMIKSRVLYFLLWKRNKKLFTMEKEQKPSIGNDLLYTTE
jgi:hypothetical protein